MPLPLHASLNGRPVSLDGADVADAMGLHGLPNPDDDAWRLAAERYVAEHPRAGGGGHAVAGAQRMAVLRRLAAGPADRTDLRRALRSAGWVGSSDLSNRLRELRATDSRSARSRMPLAIRDDGHRIALTGPFALLDDDRREALAFARSVVGRIDSALAAQAVVVLDEMVPDLADATMDPRPAGEVPIRALAAVDTALRECRPVAVRYRSASRGYPVTYDVVPREYVSVGRTLKAICVPVDAEGRRASDLDRQLVLDRIVEVTPHDDWADPDPADVAPRTERLVIICTASLYSVLEERGLYGFGTGPVEEVVHDVLKVEGAFPQALAWDVMEQLCAWSGQVQVVEPLWLLRAVMRKLRIGTAIHESAIDFVLVVPEPGSAPQTVAEALRPAPGDLDSERPPERGPARRLRPPGRS